MEPPFKKLRRSPRHEPDLTNSQNDASLSRTRSDPKDRQPKEQVLIPPSFAPTRTIDLSGFQRRQFDQYGAVPRRNANGRILPRTPDVTVTAVVVDIAILDDQDRTSSTQIVAPTTKLELPLSSVGTLTIPAIAQVTSLIDSKSSDLVPIVTSAGSLIVSASSRITSSSLPTNGTSSTPKTITVTSTSTLSVSVHNGTVASSISRYRTTFTKDGSTITRDSTSNSHEPTGYQFGDFITPSVTSIPTSAYNNRQGSTATTSSANEATSTNTNAGGVVVLTPKQQQMVGGVVGGVAGVALVLLAILYFLKWYRKHMKKQGRLPEQTLRHRQLPSGDDHAFMQPPAMTQPSGSSLLPIATFRQSLQKKLRPQSAYTLASNTTDQSAFPPPDSERSFQRISGRKIPSVLLTGGNGYGDAGPVSPISDHSGFPRSREVSQTSTYSQSPSLHAPGLGVTSGRSTPVRGPVSPFLDPPDDQDHEQFPLRTPRGFNSRSHLSIQTAGLSALNPNRHSEGSVTIRPSPARTPTTTSPTNSSLRLPMHTPPLMPGDIPEMPSLHPSRFQMPPRTFSDDALSAHRSIGQRSYSAISVRSSSSVGGRFKEEI